MVISTTVLKAQQSIVSSGGDAFSDAGFIAFSIGQVVYHTNAGTTGSVAQGVQQAYEIFTVGIQDIKYDIQLSVFPNPINEYLVLHAEDYTTVKLYYQLFDMQGKLLKSEFITRNQTKINMSHLLSGSYILIISTENKPVKQFKVIKN